MFKDFWERKKHEVQFFGILIGIGALFLAIGPPENEKAREALLNIQFFWLVIITISITILFVNFYKFSLTFEHKMRGKIWLDLEETISMVVLAGLIFFIFNVWQYISTMYRASFLDFLWGGGGFAISSIIGALLYSFWRIMCLKFQYSKSKAFFVSAGVMFFNSMVFGAWLTFVTQRGSFSLSLWLALSFFIFGVFFIFPASKALFRVEERKRIAEIIEEIRYGKTRKP